MSRFRVIRPTILLPVMLLVAAAGAHAQSDASRRGLDARAGVWDAEAPRAGTVLSKSPLFEFAFQRELEQRLALVNSVSVWRRITEEIQRLPSGGERVVETRSYVVPIMTALKFYPVTTPASAVEPYMTAGLGFALGLVDEAENAVGGGGITVVTGFGISAGLGLELHLTKALGLVAGGRFQWIRFGEDLGSEDTFSGGGIDGGITLRFPR